jgi:rhodanese-related sulfurtransferase
MINEISAEDFVKALKSGEKLDILDVRTDIECRTEVLDYPILHIPLHLLDGPDFAKKHKEKLAGRSLYVLCRGGVRAKQAAQTLSAAGIENVVVVTGGLNACCACGASTKRQQVIGLERQVRIAAGTFVSAGIILGHFLQPEFYMLSLFVGAGLIFAGITDKCGMALLLARAPWNK